MFNKNNLSNHVNTLSQLELMSIKDNVNAVQIIAVLKDALTAEVYVNFSMITVAQ
jgi:hypothetical protein